MWALPPDRSQSGGKITGDSREVCLFTFMYRSKGHLSDVVQRMNERVLEWMVPREFRLPSRCQALCQAEQVSGLSCRLAYSRRT
jgi:hypothetical protein